MRSRLTALGLVSLLVVAACGSDDDSGSDTDGAPVASPADSGAETTEPADTEPEVTEAPTTEPAPTTEAPVETEPPLAAFEPLEFGPYDVGVATITVDAESERPLTVDVWFPTDEVADVPLEQYTLIPGIYYESPAAYEGAELVAAEGPFPLVVYSHGSGGLRYIASYYTEFLASHGYVVAAPDHTGNTAVDRLLGAEAEFDVTALNRPNDVVAVIDAMLDPANVGLVDSIDAESIAVTGHSFGGFTALAMVGGYENPLGSFVADERVDAIIPLAPATGDDTRLMSDAGLESIEVPTLVIAGTNDQTTPIDPNVTRIWELASSDPLVRVDLVDAQHQSFTDVCDYQEFLPTLEAEVPQAVIDTIDSQAVEGCSPGDMPIDRAKELTNTFAVAFLDSVFRDGEMIDIDTTEFPDDVVVMAK